MDNAQRVARWLRPHAFPADIIKNPPADRLEVRHVNANEKSAAFREWPLELVDSGALATLCEEVDLALTDDATQLGSGVQRYICTVWQGEKCLGRCTVRAKGEDNEEKDDGVLSEPANAKGLVAQTMRHLEAVMKVSLVQASSAQVALSTLIKQNEQLSSIVENSLEQQMEAFKLVQELQDNKNKRDIKLLEAQGRIDSRQMMLKQAAPLFATLVKKFTGKPGEANESAMQAQFQAFIGSLDEDQRAKIIESLTPMQQVALSDMLTGGGMSGDDKEEGTPQ
jgi:hypothetical protein